MAPDKPTGTTGFPGGRVKIRGDLFIDPLKYSVNKHTTEHLFWEHFEPGSQYF
ncbi:MAG: hypothetical protein JSU69_07030 [Candidatus Zixiibacteriota bacterium]|nr:MAG: hypothetical protein JSU69_07030 [candidate division Zixibacteria bacterium]